MESDIEDEGIGLRRYMCLDCRRTFLSIEALFIGADGDEDAFRALAANLRWRNRERYWKKRGRKPPMRVVKESDSLQVQVRPGFLSIKHIPAKQPKRVFLRCQRGHDMTVAENVYTFKRKTPDGGIVLNRQCKPCRKAYQSKYAKRRYDAQKQRQPEPQERSAA